MTARRHAEVQAVDVLVPSYRRPADLARCLAGLERQSRRPDRVLVVVRHDDAATRALLAEHGGVVEVLVGRAGQVAALNAGLEHIRGDVVSILDDDTVPHPWWLERVLAVLADPAVGGCGGRDFVGGCPPDQADTALAVGARLEVGRLRWYGKLVGNHHLGRDPTRSVDFLKGANMSYRREAISDLRFDEALQGAGAQVHNDLAFSLSVGRRGWVLVYDPRCSVEHFPGSRLGADQRGSIAKSTIREHAYNQTTAVLGASGVGRSLAFLSWATLVGDRTAPGLLRTIAERERSGRDAIVASSGRARAVVHQVRRKGAR